MSRTKWRTMKFRIREDLWRFQQDVVDAVDVLVDDGYEVVDTFAENGFGYVIFRKVIGGVA